MTQPIKPHYDVVIIGAGHNGLVAASYLSKAGMRVLVAEKNNYLGGATTSKKIFPEFDASLSIYSYLISLFPQKIIQDLQLNVPRLSRAVGSFTPYFDKQIPKGLLLSNLSEAITRWSIESLAGQKEYDAYRNLLAMEQILADKIWDSFLKPLKRKSYFENKFSSGQEKNIWQAFIEEPLGKLIEATLQNDVLRGVLFTDAKIGVFTHPHDETLLQNRTFIYHIIGNKTGEWKVPKGGMQTLVDELTRIARKNGTTLLTNAPVKQIVAGNKYHSVHISGNDTEYDIQATYVLCNAAPQLLHALIDQAKGDDLTDEGSVFKINMLLKKLPTLKDPSVSPAEAFTGTFHINESYEQMQQSYQEARSGKLPAVLPSEIYCHTLTDASILSPQLSEQGFHTLTLFGLDTPYSLFAEKEEHKQEAIKRYLYGLNTYLAEPIEECLAADSSGRFCIDAKSPVDIGRELSLPQGNIFHTALSWFFSENVWEEGTWGVETDYTGIYLCGSGAKRGGAVSGIPGHNAAMKVLSQEGKKMC